MTSDKSSFSSSSCSNPSSFSASRHVILYFLFSADYVGMWATIIMETEGYAPVTIVREIIAGEIINIFASPDLAAGEHRIVLSWETERDLDIYALGRDW